MTPCGAPDIVKVGQKKGAKEKMKLNWENKNKEVNKSRKGMQSVVQVVMEIFNWHFGINYFYSVF